jgi:lysozyme
MDIEQAKKTAKVLIRKYEGCFLRPYLCPAGVPTIYYGATFYKDGRKVQLTDPVGTIEQAEDLLDWMLEKIYFPGVLKLCTELDNGYRGGALTDFAFNLGINALKNSTLRKKVNTGDWEGAKKEILKWNRGGVKVLSGLTKRRVSESILL